MGRPVAPRHAPTGVPRRARRHHGARARRHPSGGDRQPRPRRPGVRQPGHRPLPRAATRSCSRVCTTRTRTSPGSPTTSPSRSTTRCRSTPTSHRRTRVASTCTSTTTTCSSCSSAGRSDGGSGHRCARTTDPVKGRHSIAAPRFDELGDPLLDITMGAGDCLYLPRGYPHAAETVDRALRPPDDRLGGGHVAAGAAQGDRRRGRGGPADGCAARSGCSNPVSACHRRRRESRACAEHVCAGDPPALDGARDLAPATGDPAPAASRAGAATRAAWTFTPGPLLWLTTVGDRAVLGLGDRLLDMPAEAHDFLSALLDAECPVAPESLEGTGRRVACRGPATAARRRRPGACRLATSARTHRARRDEPMFATGSQVRGWLLVEVRGAWGEDAIHDSALGEHVPRHWKDELKRRHIRAVCIRSAYSSRRAAACGSSPAPPGARARERHRCGVATSRSLADVAAAVDDARMSTSRPAASGSTCSEPLILVCTNGRHDQCCANLGRPLVRALRDSPWADRRVGVLAHRRRPLRRQRRGAPRQPLLRSCRPGRRRRQLLAASRRRPNRPLPVPRAHVVLARRAGGRALRAARARRSTRSTVW